MSGIELARWVAEIRPGIAVVFMSGYTADFLNQGTTTSSKQILRKPSTRARLLVALRSALEVGSGPLGSDSA